MRQTTLATSGFDRYSKPTQRAVFLAEMDRVVPSKQLCARIEPERVNDFDTSGFGI